ncbi:B12-binding domain-containing radical SAM protein [Thermodesulfobacteriota bacterium]
MRILLIKSERLLDTDRWVVNPLGIMSLASVARSAGHEVRILDLRVERGEHVQRALDKAIEEKPDLVGLSALSHQSKTTRQVSAYIQNRLPDVFQIAGGPLANTDPEYLLVGTDIDACALGEGEKTFSDVLETLSRGGDLTKIPGLAFRNEQEVIQTPPRGLIEDLDHLPTPTWGMVDLDHYAKFVAMSARLEKRASLQTSRGCPFHCTFCHNLFGKKFRGRSPGHVLEELSMLHRKYGVRYFELIDDIFNANYDRAEEILNGIRDRLPSCRISFPNGLRADQLDRKFVRSLKQANCVGVYIAIETASLWRQKEIAKNINIEKVRKVALWLQEERIHTSCLFMVGFPGERAEEIDKTFALATELPVDLPHISVVIPYKNTPLWDRFLESGGKVSPDTLDPYYGYDQQSVSEVSNDLLRERSLRLARKRLLFNPRNWFILYAELRFRLRDPLGLFFKLLSMIPPRRWNRKLAEWSIKTQGFFENSD